MPKVQVEEYLNSDGEDSSEDEMDASKGSSPSPVYVEEKQLSEDPKAATAGANKPAKLAKLKTHATIEDFGQLDEKDIK